MNKYKALLVALIATAFKNGGENVEKINELLEGDETALDDKEALKLLLEADKDRIKAIRTKYHDDGHKKGKAETLAAFEKDLREKFELGDDVELQGLELVSHLVESAKTAKPGKELDVDALKRHPEYIKLQDSLQKQLSAKDQDWQKKLDETVNGYKKEQTFGKVQGKALEVLDALKPILSSDPAKAAKQKAILVNELKGYEFQEGDGGEIIVLKDGKVVEDGHGYRRKFDDIVKSHASEYFDFQVAKEERTAPNADPAKTPGQTPKTFTGQMPKNEEEYIAAISNDATPLADRMAIKEAWTAQQNKA